MRTGGRVLVGLASLVFLMPRSATAQAGAVLADADLRIQGLHLTVAPARQEVDPGRPAVVRTSLGDVAPAQLGAGVLVAADLSGPGLEEPLALTTAPGEPFAVPGLNREGTYALTGIRLVAGGRTLLAAEPDRVEILVHRLVISSVTSRPLTAAEIARAGIVIADDSYRVYRYTVGFQTASGTVEIGFDLVTAPDGRVLLPSTPDGQFALPAGAPGAAPVPQVQAFSLPIPGGGGEPNPPAGSAPGGAIPGFLIIPGDMAFLHQFFAVILVVQNGALEGSNLRLRDLAARLELTGDGLRQAETSPPTVPGQPVPLLDPGPDGAFGTTDDLTFLVAQASGQASWLVEGLEEGSHLVRVALDATIDGLASGAPATVSGRVPGIVVVRDPRFALTFFHPQTVRAGESYEHRVVVSNLSTTPVYNLAMSLPATQLTGVRLADGEPARHDIAELLPGESQAVAWRLESLRTGRVIASAFNTSDPIFASFRFRVGVGELGIPLSPETLVLPAETELLGDAVREPALSLLGLGYSLSTSQGAVVEGLPPVGETIVRLRARELAAHAKRIAWGEDADRAVVSLALAWQGASVWDDGFDALRRASRRGRQLEGQMGAALGRLIDRHGPEAAFAELEDVAITGRPTLLAAAHGAGADGTARLVVSGAASGRIAAGQSADTTLFARALPGAALLDVRGAGWQGEVAPVVVPLEDAGDWAEGGYQVRLHGTAAGSVDLEAAIVLADGSTRRLDCGPVATAPGSTALLVVPQDGDASLWVDGDGDGIVERQEPIAATLAGAPPARLLAARLDTGLGPTRKVIAMLLSQPVDGAALAAGDPSAWLVTSHLDLPDGAGRLVVDRDRRGETLVAQDDPRFLLLGLDAPLNPHATLALSSPAAGVPLLGGRSVAIGSAGLSIPAGAAGGAVRGVILGPSGAAVPGAIVELYESDRVDSALDGGSWVLHRLDRVTADASGAFVLDAVRLRDAAASSEHALLVLRAVDPLSGHEGRASSRLTLPGSVRVVNVAMLGRGDVIGTLRRADGAPLVQPLVQARSVTNPEELASAAPAADGSFLLRDLPVGPLQVLGRDATAHVWATTAIPGAGQQAEVELVLPAGAPPATGDVHGQVLNLADAGPLPGVQVYAIPAGASAGTHLATTSDDGEFAMSGVRAGDVTFRVWDPTRGRYVGERTIQVLADSDNDVQVLVSFSSGGVSGTVYRLVAGERRPVAGALVYTAAGGATTTDASGGYALAELPLGSVTVNAVDPASRERASRTVTLTADGQIAVVDLDLVGSSGAIEGTVVDRAGQPVGGATVAAGRFGSGHETRSGSDGRFRIDGLEPGPVDVLVSLGKRLGRGRTTIPFNGAVAETTVVLGGTVSLDVVTIADTQGGTTAQVLSQLSYRRPGITSDGTIGPLPEDGTTLFPCPQGGAGECSVDDTGRAHLRDLPEGVGSLQVRAENAFYGGQSAAEDLDPGDEGRLLTIHFNAPGTVSGRIVEVAEGSATPVAGAIVELWTVVNQWGGLGPQQRVTTEAGGAFTFQLVRPGSFEVRAFDPSSGRIGRVTGAMASTQTIAGLDVELQGLGGFGGEVRICDGGAAPGTGAQVHLRVAPEGLPYPFIGSDGDVVEVPGLQTRELDLDFSTGQASFAFTGLVTGAWSVRATTAANGGAGLGAWVPADGTVAILPETLCLAPLGSIRGRVVRPESGEGESGASVTLWTDRCGRLESCAFGVETSDAAGEFAFTGLPVGASYLVVAFSALTNRGGQVGPVRLCAPSSPGFGESCVQDAEVDVTLAPFGEVAGTVSRASGEPVGNAYVHLVADIVAVGGGGTAITQTREWWTFADGGGAFGFSGIPAGTARLVASDPSSPLVARRTVTVDPLVTPRTEANITLPPTSAVAVEVLDPAGTPVSGAVPVVAFRQSSSHFSSALDALRQDNPAVFSGVVAGGYNLRACVGPCLAPLFGRLFTADELGAEASPVMPDPPAEQAVQVRLVGRASVRARVLDGNGQPRAGAEVTVAGGGFYGGMSTVTQSGGDGLAPVIGGLGVGHYSIAASVSDLGGNRLRGVASLEIRQEDHGQQLEVEVRLEDAAAVRGTVVTAAGEPAAGALATLRYQAPVQGWRSFQAVVGSDGTLAFAAVPSGFAYELEVFEAGSRPGRYRRHALPIDAAHLDAEGVFDLGELRLDDANPTVPTIEPPNGAVQVEAGAEVVVEFSEPMRHDSLDGLVRLRRQGESTPLPVTLSAEDVDPDGAGPEAARTRVTLGHAPFDSNVLYLVDVLQGVEDLAGRTLSFEVHATFRTRDSVAPRVIQVVPADDPVGISPVGPDVEPVVTFSEAVDPASAAVGLALVGADGQPVAIQVEIERDGFDARLRPAAGLMPDARYEVRAGTAVTDVAGNPLAEAVVATFRVRDLVPPVVTILPPVGATVDGDAWSVVERTAVTLRAAVSTNDPLSQVTFLVDGVTLPGTPLLDVPSGEYRLGWTAPAMAGQLQVGARARDVSGNVSEPAAHALTVVDDAPPAGVLSVTPNEPPYPNHTFVVTVDGTDDHGLARAVVTVSGVYAESRVLTFAAGTTGRVSAEFRVPASAAAGLQIVVAADVEDTLGQSTPIAAVSLAVRADTTAPAITRITPGAGASVIEGQTVAFEFRLDDEVAISGVTLDVGGEAQTAQLAVTALPGDRYRATAVASWRAPAVSAQTAVSFTLTAVDQAGNSETSTGEVLVQPQSNSNAPVVTISCPRDGDGCAPGAALAVSFTLSDADQIRDYSVFVNDAPEPTAQELPVNATSFSGAFAFTAPSSAATGSTHTIRIQARDFAENVGQASVTVTVPEGLILHGDQTLDSGRDGQSLVLAAGTFNAVSPLVLESLVLCSGAVLVGSQEQVLALELAGDLRVACGSSIDMSARGFAPGATNPGAALPGGGSGGSHLGVGGVWDHPSGSTYGSVERPQECGAGGMDRGAWTYPTSGGGAIRIVVGGKLTVDGAIRASGGDYTSAGDGAGGSIWLRASTAIMGSGAIEARGGQGGTGSGGGGAVAVLFGSTSGRVLENVRTTGGAGGHPGGAGTVFLKGPGAAFGDLVVDNMGLEGRATVLPSLGSGAAQPGSSGAVLVTDRNEAIPAWFEGHWIEVAAPGGEIEGTWRAGEIGADGKTVMLVPNEGEAIDVEPGDRWQGVYRFDRLTTRGGARLESRDPVLVGEGAPNSANRAPRVDTARVAWGYDAVAPATWVLRVAGGAIRDNDPPIALELRNRRNGSTWSTMVGDGESLTWRLVGGDNRVGDVLDLQARDSHPASPASRIVVLAPLPAASPPQVDLGKIALLPLGMGFQIVGRPGAVVDADQPVTLHLTNSRTGAVPPFAANLDGSFYARLDGETGDGISLVATDGGSASTESCGLGTLPEGGWHVWGHDLGHAIELFEWPFAVLDGGHAVGRIDEMSLDAANLYTGLSNARRVVHNLKLRGPMALDGGDLVGWIDDGSPASRQARPLALSPGTLVRAKTRGDELFIVAEEPEGIRLYRLEAPVDHAGAWLPDCGLPIVSVLVPGTTGLHAVELLPAGDGLVAILIDTPAGELALVDASEEAALEWIGTAALPGNEIPLWADWGRGELAVGRAEGTVEIWRWSDTALERYAVWRPTQGQPVGVARFGDELFIGLDTGVVQQVTLVDPALPRLIGERDLGVPVVAVVRAFNGLFFATPSGVAEFQLQHMPPTIDPDLVAWGHGGGRSWGSLALTEDRGYATVTWGDGSVATVNECDYCEAINLVDLSTPPTFTMTSFEGVPARPYTPPAMRLRSFDRFTAWQFWAGVRAPQASSCVTDLAAAGAVHSTVNAVWGAFGGTGRSEIGFSSLNESTSERATATLANPSAVVDLLDYNNYLVACDDGVSVWDVDPARGGSVTGPVLVHQADLFGASPVERCRHNGSGFVVFAANTPGRYAMLDPQPWYDGSSTPAVLADDVVLPALEGRILDVQQQPERLFVLTDAGSAGRLYAYSIAVPTAPELLGQADLAPGAPAAAMIYRHGEDWAEGSESLLVVRRGWGIELWSPELDLLSALELPGDPRDAFWAGNTYVILGDFGIAQIRGPVTAPQVNYLLSNWYPPGKALHRSNSAVATPEGPTWY